MQFQGKERTAPLFLDGKRQRNFLDGKGPACVLHFIARAFAWNFLLYIQIKIKMFVFRARKITFINFGLLFIFLSYWLSWYMYLLVRSIVKEYSAYEMTDGSFQYGMSEELEFLAEHFFYGKVSYADVPSLFGGSNILFFDKIFSKFNGDSKWTFVL